jgi:FMN reductase
VPTGVLAAGDDWGDRGLADRIERAGGELADLVAGRAATAPADPFADVVPFEALLRRA